MWSLAKKSVLLARHLSVVRTLQVWLHVSQNISGLYRLGLKVVNNPRYRLLRRKLWTVRFFPLAVFPTISQTLAAEALAISMEAPMGNARDAAKERRLRRKRENAKVRVPRRRPSFSFPTTQKCFSFSGAFSCEEYQEMSSENSTMLLVACVVGQLAGGFRRSWQFAKREARGRLRFFNGKRALRDVHSEDFRDWEVEQFADALVLRSLRATPGVWRLLV